MNYSEREDTTLFTDEDRGASFETKRTSISIRVRSFLTAFTPQTFSTATSTFNYGCKAPTTEGGGGCYLSVENSNRSLEPREEDLEYHTGQGCFWPRQHSSHYDTGMRPALLRRFISGSHIARTRWLTNRIGSSSGYPAPLFVERSSGGRVERNRTRSVGPCVMRWSN